MPLWLIFHPPTVFQDAESKAALARDITKVYTDVGLPAFYVVVEFVPVPVGSTFVGGQVQPSDEKPPFIRIHISNIARRLPDGESKLKHSFLGRVDRALKPYIADKGYDWEYHVVETDRSLWKIQGMVPPLPKTEEEQIWVKENKPLPWSGAYPPEQKLEDD